MLCYCMVHVVKYMLQMKVGLPSDFQGCNTNKNTDIPPPKKNLRQYIRLLYSFTCPTKCFSFLTKTAH